MNGCKPVARPLVANEKFQKVDGSKEVDVTYIRSLVGNLLYLTLTRPDIMYATSLLSRFMLKPTQINLRAAKRNLRYLQGTIDFGIRYKKGKKLELYNYSDSDWAGSVDAKRITSRYAFSLGSGLNYSSFLLQE